MVILGLLLVLLGILVVVVGVFGLGYDRDEDMPGRETVEVLGWNTTPEVVFFLGVAAALLILLGLWSMKFGAKRNWAKRQETKRLNEMHDKLAAADAASKDSDEH